MKISHTLIHNGISFGIPEGTKVPEKPMATCTNFIGNPCGVHTVCACYNAQNDYNNAIPSLLSLAVAFEDQDAIRKLLTDQSNYTDKGELTKVLFFKERFKDGIYPLEGVECEKVWQYKTRGEWRDGSEGQCWRYGFEGAPTQSVLRLIPQPNSEHYTNHSCPSDIEERKTETMESRAGADLALTMVNLIEEKELTGGSVPTPSDEEQPITQEIIMALWEQDGDDFVKLSDEAMWRIAEKIKRHFHLKRI
jgi:hypothetical protein